MFSSYVAYLGHCYNYNHIMKADWLTTIKNIKYFKLGYCVSFWFWYMTFCPIAGNIP